MRSRRSAADCEEFPTMTEAGLYASRINGDGNCMFSACSDAFYGHPNHAAEIRKRVCDHVEENADWFKQFVTVDGENRRPKRKNVSAYSTPYDQQTPPAEEIDRAFYERLKTMRQGGTWGDNVELQAFANVYNCIVKIWKTDGTYEVSPVGGQGKQKTVETAVHIAYHSWQHYSSVRRVNGPRTGHPDIPLRHLNEEHQAAILEKRPASTQPEDWKIDLVQKSVPFFINKAEIIKQLIENNCDIDLAVASLTHQQESRENSSAQESSSIERDHDSDDDDFVGGPNKRRTNKSFSRERSEPSPSTAPSVTPPSSVDGRPMLPAKSRAKHAKWPTKSHRSSRESTAGSETRPSQEQMAFMRRRIVTDDSDDDLKSYSDGTASTPTSPKKPVRLRLTMPKPPKDLKEADDAQKESQPASKSAQKQTGPQPKKKGMSARDKKDFRKQAQKAARRERQQQTLAEQSASPAAAETPASTAIAEQSASTAVAEQSSPTAVTEVSASAAVPEKSASKLPIIPGRPQSDSETAQYQRRPEIRV